MDIKKQWNESNNIWNITLKGEIDIYNVPEFKEILLSIPDEKEGNINIDCTDPVSYTHLNIKLCKRHF